MAVNKSMLILRGALLLSLFGAGASQLTGCAQDVGTVDRTRPDKVKKSIFEGDDEWYFRQTVIDGPTQGGGGVGGESTLKRIRWTITEDTLFALSTTEPAIGTEKGLQDEKDRRLGVVAAFPIVKHFDIQRGYSSSTGQLSNTIEENTSDRLWYQRDYMRVDWSRNQIDGIQMMTAAMGHYSNIARTINEADSTKDYDRARISDDKIDIVTEYYFEPDLYSCAMNYGYESIYNCEAGPVKVRNSFVKVPKEKTFEPTPYFDYTTLKDKDGKPIRKDSAYATEIACDPTIKHWATMQNGAYDPDACVKPATFDLFSRFGYFRTERAAYSKRRGATYIAQKKYFANHWNIWQTAYDEDGNLLKLEDRKPKQIVYYLNVGFPQEDVYKESVHLLQESWNEIFTKTVRLTHNFTERTGQSIYSWMMNLLAAASKADGKGDLPDVDEITARLEYPTELAGKALVYMQGLDAESPSQLASGWKAFCAIHNAQLPSCDSMTAEELKDAVDAKIASFVGTTTDFDLQREPLFATVFELARVYMTSVGSGFSATESQLNSYYRKVKGSVVDKSLRSSLPEPNFDDDKGTKVRQFIADNNGGDDHMFRIKENSCSPGKLEEWQKSYGTVNEEVASLFAAQGSNVKDSLMKLPVKDLKEFCAQLEWATKDEQDKAARFDWQRVGDLRYSFVNWVNSEVGYLGLGPSAADPETGEIISATANFAGRAIAMYAARAADTEMFYDGRITEDDLKTSSYITEDLQDHGSETNSVLLLDPAKAKTPLLSAGTSGQLAGTLRDWKATDLISPEHRAIGVDNKELTKNLKLLAKDGGVKGLQQKQLLNYKNMVRSQEAKLKQINQLMSDPSSLAIQLADPAYAALVDEMAKERFGEGPYTKDQRDSILSYVNTPTLQEREREAFERKQSMRNIYPLEALSNAIDAIVSLRAWGDYFKDKSRDEIERYFKKGAFYGVQLHELGHTFGLRHNFKGSVDALNYNPGYWEVVAKSYDDPKLKDAWYLSRDEYKAVTGRELPGAVDFYNQAEFRGTASIMDYSPSLNLDFTGLGAYDDAAIQFVYGKKIEVYDDSVNFMQLDGISLELFLDYKNYPAVFVGPYSVGGTKLNNGLILGYVDVPELEKIRGERYPAAIHKMLTARRWVSIDEFKEMKVKELQAKSQIVSEKLKGKENLGNVTSGDLGLQNNDAFAQVRSVTAVPYKFCSDEYRGSTPGCEVWDWGANQEEVADYRIHDFENFKYRARYAHGILPLMNQTLRAYYGRLSRTLNLLQGVYYQYAWIYLTAKRDYYAYTKDLENASIKGLNFIAKLYAQPEPGKYCLKTYSNGDKEWELYDEDNGVTCDKDEYAIITPKDGVSYYYKASDTYIPYYWRLPGAIDKSLAIQSLFLVTGRYALQSLSTDIRSGQISYWEKFRDRILSYFEGIVLNDPSKFAGAIDENTKEYVPPTLVQPEEWDAYRNNVNPGPYKDPLDKPGLSRVSVYNRFTQVYEGLLFSIVLNNTFMDNQDDMNQYLKVCASNDECDDDYMKIDVNYNDGTSVTNGRKVVSYTVNGNNVTGESTTYYSKGGAFEVHTFYTPNTAEIYRAPFRTASGPTIASKLIDRLNLIVYGTNEPVLDGVQELDMTKVGGYYLQSKKEFDDFVKNEAPGTKDYTVKKRRFDRANDIYQTYLGYVNIIRDTMKRYEGLY